MMGNHEHERVRDQRLDQAAVWIARLRGPALTSLRQRRFLGWFEADAGNPEAFDEIAMLWERLEVVTALELPACAGAQRAFRRWTLVPAAACLVLIVAVAMVLSGDVRYTTQVGEHSEIVLEDGTKLALNTNTQVEVSLTPDHRHLTLHHGEAYVEVVEDPARPFVLTTPHGRVEALGTAFGVHVLADGSRVFVGEGKVVVYRANQTDQAGGAAPTLAAGSEMVFDVRDVLRTGSVDLAVAIAWREDRLVYDGVTLEQMIKDLNRYMPRKMVITDRELAETRVSAVLRIEEQQATLNALARILPIAWTELSDKVIVLRPIG